MKRLKKLFVITLIFCIFLSVLSGCSNKSDFVLSFELDARPTTLDPQLASTTAETVLVRNLYEGLMRVDTNGTVVPAAASDVSVSSDGLNYTFKISGTAKWRNGNPVTANDFAFALQRAVTPVTQAPLAETLFTIKNAEGIAKGQADVSSLGVKATDDKTLTITLKQKDDQFLKKLTTSVCMPCNKTFFEKTGGKYGRDSDDVLTNGSFQLKRWLDEQDFSMRIIKGKEYSGKFKPSASAIIFTTGDFATRNTRIEQSYIDMGFVHYSNAGTGKNEKAAYTAFENSCYALVLNKTATLANTNIRLSLERALHRNLYRSELPGYLKPANFIVPSIVSYNGTPLSGVCKYKAPADYDPSTAHSLYLAGVDELNGSDLSGTTILYPDDENIHSLTSLIAENWQEALGAYVNIEKVSSVSSLESRISAGNYQISIVPISADSTDPKNYLTRFTSNSPLNIYGFKNSTYDSYISSLGGNLTKEQYLSTVTKAVNLIADSHSVIPLCYTSTVFAASSSVITPAVTADNGCIDLAYVKMK